MKATSLKRITVMESRRQTQVHTPSLKPHCSLHTIPVEASKSTNVVWSGGVRTLGACADKGTSVVTCQHNYVDVLFGIFAHLTALAAVMVMINILQTVLLHRFHSFAWITILPLSIFILVLLWSSVSPSELAQAVASCTGILPTGTNDTGNDVLDGICKPFTLISARGTYEDPNLGNLVGPPFVYALNATLARRTLLFKESTIALPTVQPIARAAAWMAAGTWFR